MELYKRIVVALVLIGTGAATICLLIGAIKEEREGGYDRYNKWMCVVFITMQTILNVAAICGQ